MSEGWRTSLRYLRHAPRFWSSPVSRAVVDRLELQAGEVVLDVGAGMGAGTFPAAQRVGPSETGRVVVAEPDPIMSKILAARRLASGKQRLTVELHLDSFDNLPAADGYIDAAFAVNVMHHVPDHAHAAAELARVVKPGGRVLLVDEDFDDPTHPDHEHWTSRHGGDDAHHGDHDHDHYDMFEPATLAGQLEAAGFSSTDVTLASLAGVPVRSVAAVR